MKKIVCGGCATIIIIFSFLFSNSVAAALPPILNFGLASQNKQHLQVQQSNPSIPTVLQNRQAPNVKIPAQRQSRTLAVSSVYTVNSTGNRPDSNVGDGICSTVSFGECTLRAAIQESNILPGRDTILFNISGPGPHVISTSGRLPGIWDEVVIDGTSEPNYVSEPVVEIVTAVNSLQGLDILTNSSTISGLGIRNANTAILVRGINNTISHNKIDQSRRGIIISERYNVITHNNLLPGNDVSIEILGDSNIVENNSISGRFGGVSLESGAEQNIIRDNLFNGRSSSSGLSIWGINNSIFRNEITNFFTGIMIYSDQNEFYENTVRMNSLGVMVYGNLNTFEDNTISDNGTSIYGWSDGLRVKGSDNYVSRNNLFNNAAYGLQVNESVGNIILANKVASNGSSGIFITSTDNTLIEGNLVEMNGATGIFIWESEDAVIENNISRSNTEAGLYLLGTNDSEALSNTISENGLGVLLRGSQHSHIHNNIIYNNQSDGILMTTARYSGGNIFADNVIFNNLNYGLNLEESGAQVSGNATYNNGSLGIMVSSYIETTINDPGDFDLVQNHPEHIIFDYDSLTHELTVSGRLDTQPGTYQIEFFLVDTPDSSMYGEGDHYIQSTDVVVDALNPTGEFIEVIDLSSNSQALNFIANLSQPGLFYVSTTATGQAKGTSGFSKIDPIIRFNSATVAFQNSFFVPTTEVVGNVSNLLPNTDYVIDFFKTRYGDMGQEFVSSDAFGIAWFSSSLITNLDNHGYEMEAAISDLFGNVLTLSHPFSIDIIPPPPSSTFFNLCKTYYADTDGDGFGDSQSTQYTCAEGSIAGYIENQFDLDDTNPFITIWNL